ncbi:hypothetical protein CC2G_015216 [Coprinopsis cinerea AmutBmut pab1-1]|nr:hypothetical protein CC2G_015216 [Coprinopsis cinerea AmutBmut pab1-1]
MNFEKPPLPAGPSRLLLPLALYLQELLRFKNDPTAPRPIPPKELDLGLQSECEVIADVTFAAFRNPSASVFGSECPKADFDNPEQVKWSLTEYTKASKGGKKSRSRPGKHSSRQISRRFKRKA